MTDYCSYKQVLGALHYYPADPICKDCCRPRWPSALLLATPLDAFYGEDEVLQGWSVVFPAGMLREKKRRLSAEDAVVGCSTSFVCT